MEPTSTNRRTRRFVIGVLTALAVATIALGLLGYWRVGLTPGDGANATGFFGRLQDLLYAALQLLMLGGKDVKGDIFLLWARWFGALFVFAIVVKFLVPRVDERITRWRASWMRGHRVIIGLGDKGRTLARVSTEEIAGQAQRDVVAIDVDGARLDDPLMARRGLTLLCGDARTPATRNTCALVEAESVVVVTESETKNIEIARLIAAEASTRRRRPDALRVFAHVADPALRRESFAGVSHHEKALLRPFGLASAAARLVLTEHPPQILARENGSARANVVFVGFDAYAEELLLHVLRLGPLDGQLPPRTTVFTRDAAGVLARLARRVPALLEMAERPQFHEFDPAGEPTAQDFALAEDTDTPVTACYVHAATDAACFSLALRTRRAAQRQGRWKAPLFMRVGDAAPFADLLATQFADNGFAEETIFAFGELERTLAATVDAEWRELLAQLVHRAYRQLQETKVDGVRSFAVTATEVAWCRLSEELRESNRRAVEHYPLKLASAGRVMRADIPLLQSALELDAETKDRLGRMEHDAWSRERRLAGWRPGTPRDDMRRIHPDLVPYDELGDAQKKDTSQIERIEQQLRAPDHPELARLLSEARERDGPSVFRERVIGLAGHTVLELDSARAVAAAVARVMTDMQAVDRLGPGGDEFWTFVTPLAPGGDYILANAVLNWLAARSALNRPRRRYRMLVVQDLPLRVLVSMWRDAGGFKRGTPDGVVPASHPDFSSGDASADDAALVAMLRAFVSRRADVERFIDLSPPGATAGDYRTAESRHAGLERTNAYLLSQCDDLIAAFEPQRYSQPGFDRAAWRAIRDGTLPVAGTGALVRAWLRDRVPARSSAVPQLAADGLHWIDPSQRETGAAAADDMPPELDAEVVAALKRLTPAKTSARRALFLRVSREGSYKRSFRNEAFDERARRLAPDGREPLVAVAEGDSWFDYPTLLDFLDHAQADGWLNIWRESHLGDTLAQMRGAPQLHRTLERVHALQPQVFLLSCGGNDIMGRSGLLRDVIVRAEIRAKSGKTSYLDEDAVRTHVRGRLLADLRALTGQIFAAARGGSPHMRIFIHGYDYAFPDGRSVMPAPLGRALPGPWLSPALHELGYLTSPRPRGPEVHAAAKAIRELMDVWNETLREFAESSGGRVIHVDLRDSLPHRTRHWVNETHPSEEGFRIVAEKLRDKVLETMRRG